MAIGSNDIERLREWIGASALGRMESFSGAGVLGLHGRFADGAPRCLACEIVRSVLLV